MKNRIISALIAAIIVVTSAAPSFAATRLSRPVIADITNSNSSVTINWDEVKHADSYKIYKSTSKDSDFDLIGTTSKLRYSDKNVSKGVKYYYKVRAISDSNTYENSRLSKWRSGYIPGAKTTDSQTVYITKTGKKYHNYGCRSLRKSCISISKSNAQAQGYTACAICW